MSFISTFRTGNGGLAVEFVEGGVYERETGSGSARIPDRINIDLAGVMPGDATLSLSIADARALLAALPGVLAEHDALEAERSASAVGEAA